MTKEQFEKATQLSTDISTVREMIATLKDPKNSYVVVKDDARSAHNAQVNFAGRPRFGHLAGKYITDLIGAYEEYLRELETEFETV